MKYLVVLFVSMYAACVLAELPDLPIPPPLKPGSGPKPTTEAPTQAPPRSLVVRHGLPDLPIPPPLKAKAASKPAVVEETPKIETKERTLIELRSLPLPPSLKEFVEYTREYKVLPTLEEQYEEVRDELGQYAFRYQTEEGTIVEESGYLVLTDDETDYVLIKEGSFIFAVDGQVYRVCWTAGRHGFQASGAHLPTSVEA